MKRFSYLFLLLAAFTLYSCVDEPKPVEAQKKVIIPPPVVVKEFGFNLNDYVVERVTVQPGDSFGKILSDSGIDYGTIQQITDSVKTVFDTRLIKVGKPYILLKSKDTLEQAQVFIYEQNQIDYVVLDFKDEVKAAAEHKPVTYVERIASGTINNNLSTTFDDLGLSSLVAYKMADIYAWTINFFKLDAGDRFKVIYTEKYVNDTIPAGFSDIKACWFEHKGKPLYAFRFTSDSIVGKSDYFDEEANNLRRAFLKGPLKFSRISSRYNLKRRIAYYGNRIRPHKGTDFAGAVGTPIMATANGTVEKSEY
ncbi:MAG: M23 family peptidase, partial [Leeuwenhoekiella sp.]